MRRLPTIARKRDGGPAVWLLCKVCASLPTKLLKSLHRLVKTDARGVQVDAGCSGVRVPQELLHAGGKRRAARRPRRPARGTDAQVAGDDARGPAGVDEARNLGAADVADHDTGAKGSGGASQTGEGGRVQAQPLKQGPEEGTADGPDHSQPDRLAGQPRGRTPDRGGAGAARPLEAVSAHHGAVADGPRGRSSRPPGNACGTRRCRNWGTSRTA